MVPTGDLWSCLGCGSVGFQGFESNIKNLPGLCEGGQRKLLQLFLPEVAKSWG